MPTKQTAVGWAMIAGALALMLFNVSDTISDLKDWHGVTGPAVVGPILKQISAVLLGAVGGANIPQLSKT